MVANERNIFIKHSTLKVFKRAKTLVFQNQLIYQKHFNIASDFSSIKKACFLNL